jgi:hypothetical protein
MSATGLSRSRLGRMRDIMAGYVERGQVPGIVTLVSGLGTSWSSDPGEDMVAILLTQRLWDSPNPPGVYLDFWTSAYQAIDD